MDPTGLDYAAILAAQAEYGDGPAPAGQLAIRVQEAGADPGLRRLAELEGRRLGTQRFLVAELDGEAAAALSLDGSLALADPFRRSEELLELLRIRLGHLRGAAPRRRARLRLRRRLSRRAPAVAPMPPGSGRFLIS